jgi:hypothetical protein
VGIILIKKDEKRNERKEYIKNKTIFKVFNVTSTMWSGMRHANGHGLRPQCAVQFYCCYNTDRKKKKSEERRKVHRLNLFFLWAGEVVGKCWKKKHGVVSVVTTEKTRGLFKSL